MISYKPLVITLKKKKLDILKLQEMLGKKDDFLKRTLNEQRYVSLKTIDEICAVLKCKVSDVIEWQEGEQKIIKVNKHVKIDWDKLVFNLRTYGATLQSESVRLGHSEGWLSNIRSRGEMAKSTLRNICCKYDFDYESMIINVRTSDTFRK